jgi:hypothetical protein
MAMGEEQALQHISPTMLPINSIPTQRGQPGLPYCNRLSLMQAAVQSLGNLSFKYKVAGLVDNDEALLLYTTSVAPLGSVLLLWK